MSYMILPNHLHPAVGWVLFVEWAIVLTLIPLSFVCTLVYSLGTLNTFGAETDDPRALHNPTKQHYTRNRISSFINLHTQTIITKLIPALALFGLLVPLSIYLSDMFRLRAFWDNGASFIGSTLLYALCFVMVTRQPLNTTFTLWFEAGKREWRCFFV